MIIKNYSNFSGSKDRFFLAIYNHNRTTLINTLSVFNEQHLVS